ncbi:MAG: DUF1727 domain-containing protein [Ruminococcaceae bacterium]|nr:DUF1727 domain-containing protein [Oscillospiraceae bacterium]
MAMKIRLILAIWACKLTILVSRMLGKKGSSMPGQVALKICPRVMTMLASKVKRDVIVVCGTNGKTTTNTLLATMLEASGHRVVCNKVGANMIWGVCCAFCEKADWLGRLNADFACLEVDEASTVKVFAHIKPDYMVVTNLFQDQLDRYGEVDLTVDFLRRALALSPDTKLILNGDDPVVAQLGEEKGRISYYVGVDEKVNEDAGEGSEGRFCPFCGKALVYEYHHYSQLGKFACPGCEFRRREPDFRVHGVSLNGGLSFKLTHSGKTASFDVDYRGFYNVYNIALSYSGAVMAMGTEPDHQAVLASYQPQTGRMESFVIDGKTVILNLAKNPAGFNQALTTVMADTRQKNILIGVNDNPSDGQDISWIWSVDFERLCDESVKNLVVTGRRADDLMLRMKHGGFAEDKQVKSRDLKEAVQALLAGSGEVSYALVNYTVVFNLQKFLKDMEGGAGHGA